ncbi:MAG: hypothetical protein AB8B72_14295 [Crocinitomicaceae bacterium]
MKTVITTISIIISLSGYSSSGIAVEKIDSILAIVENVVSKEWFILKKTDGFEITFCSTCQRKYEDSVAKSGVKGLLLKRNDFYKIYGPDSVSYYSIVNSSYNNTEKNFLKIYPKNGVLRFSVTFDNVWSIDKIKETQNFNNELKTVALANSISRSNNEMFSDYRFWLPDAIIWRNKNTKSDFKKLPYYSHWLNFSIFITQDKPYFFAGIGLIEKNTFTSLEEERKKALTQIAFALGINDYKILN